MSRAIAGVMGPGEQAAPEDIANARRIGELLARDGWVVLSGGRDSGVMRAVNDGAKLVPGSLTVGILGSNTSQVAPGVDVAIVTDMGQARNNINVLSSHVIIACGVGGPGTVSEIALALKAGRPVILLGADEPARDFFRRLGGPGVAFAATPEEASALARRHWAAEHDT